MAQVAFEKNIGSEWIDVTTLATLTADEVYYIQNRGAGVLLAQEKNIEPTDEAGTVVMPYKILKYTNNGKLWVKSLSGLCTINITDKNAPAPAPQVLELLCEELDGFGDEVVEEGVKYNFNVIGYDGEDAYRIDFDLSLNPTGVFENISVTKDGQSASSANMFMRIFLVNADPIDIPTSELTITETEESSWLFEWSSADGYAGTFGVESDPDAESGVRLVYGEATKDGEVVGSGLLFVKAEL